MFDRLLALFRNEIPEHPLPDLDSDYAMGALLVRMAKSDAHYDPSEIATIDEILATSFDLGPLDAAKMRADCERLEAQAPDTAAFTALICAHVPHAKRVRVMEALVRTAIADGKRTPEEDQLLQNLAQAFECKCEMDG